jgi:hypothetical protein
MLETSSVTPFMTGGNVVLTGWGFAGIELLALFGAGAALPNVLSGLLSVMLVLLHLVLRGRTWRSGYCGFSGLLK